MDDAAKGAEPGGGDAGVGPGKYRWYKGESEIYMASRRRLPINLY